MYILYHDIRISIVKDGMYRLLFIIPLLSRSWNQFCKVVQKQNITRLINNMGGRLTSVKSSFLKQKAKNSHFLFTIVI